MSYELHPLCTFFPRMPDAEFEALREDIKANGLRQKIVLHDGMILDGSHRYRACIEAGIAPQFVDYNGDNLLAYVRSVNLHRRHMTTGQQAVIVASMQDWAKAQVAGSNQHTQARSGNVAGPPEVSTVADRAAQSGASDRTQRMADKVVKADPDLAKQVGRGEVSLPAAVAQVDAKKPQKAKPANTTIATPPEKRDEAPGPVVIERPATAAALAKAAKQESKAVEENVSLKARIAELEEELSAYQENCADLRDEVKALSAAVDPNHAKKFLEQTGYVRVLESQRNELLDKNARLAREVKSLQKRLGHA